VKSEFCTTTLKEENYC